MHSNLFINCPNSWINKINGVHLESALHDDGLAGLAAAIEPGSRNRTGPLLLFYDLDQLVLADPYSSVRVQHLSKHNHLFYSIKIEGPENRTHKESVWFLLCGDCGWWGCWISANKRRWSHLFRLVCLSQMIRKGFHLDMLDTITKKTNFGTQTTSYFYI